ncbi:MAG: hypothetical protein PUF09_08360, partial [Bacteroidales bacterium]|nr:hypothetical protein [Bacteroidales bacterium]
MFVLIANAMYRTLLATCGSAAFQMFVLIANAMYRTLLATCGSAVFQMFVLFEVVINEPTFPLSH